MSLEYPCVYHKDGKCVKDPPEPDYVDWCVYGPCSHETPSNADRIRAMSDKEEETMPEIERIMERICDLCHHPYVVTDQDAMDEICNACPVEAEIRALLKENAHGTAQA